MTASRKHRRARRALLALIPLVMVSQFGLAHGPGESSGCIDTSNGDVAVTLTGRVEVGSFTDPLGTERAYLLRLQHEVCIEDAAMLAEPQRAFEVQLAASGVRMETVLRRSLGRRVVVTGRPFAAHTRHHHRPMVVIVDGINRPGN